MEINQRDVNFLVWTVKLAQEHKLDDCKTLAKVLADQSSLKDHRATFGEKWFKAFLDGTKPEPALKPKPALELEPEPDPELVNKLAQSVEGLDISARSKEILIGKHTDDFVYELVQKNEAYLLKIGLNEKSVKRIKELLAAMGLALGQKLDEKTLAAVRAEIARQRR